MNIEQQIQATIEALESYLETLTEKKDIERVQALIEYWQERLLDY